MFRIIVVSDDEDALNGVAQGAGNLPDVVVTTLRSLQAVASLLEKDLCDLLIIDLATETERGVELLVAVRHALPALPIIAVTDMKVRDYDRQAMKLGVSGFLVKPVRDEHVGFQIAHAQEVQRIQRQNSALRDAVKRGPEFGEIVGSSSEIRSVFDMIRRASASSVPVSLYGESGTGKELVARAIHRLSGRRTAEFVSINPSAIPETLLESELFGHARGAFTGAVADRKGYVEMAQGGTLFLDEIGDLPLSFQGKLLRVLQEKKISRVGTSKLIDVDFRLITATNKDLLAEVHAGRFREDLFYRIHVFPIFMPPLRSRRGDIPVLVEHFLNRYAVEMGRSVPSFALPSLEILQAHSWPGNVRELENVVHRLVAMSLDATEIDHADVCAALHLPKSARAGVSSLSSPAMSEIKPLADHTRDYVEWVLKQLGGNKSRAARVLGIDRATLQRKLQDPGRSS